MRGLVLLGVFAVLVGSLLAAQPAGCRMEVVLDTGVPERGHAAVAAVTDGLAERGVETVTRQQQMLLSRDKAFDPDRLRPAWLGRRDSVKVFADAAGRDAELGRARRHAGEVVLAVGLLESDLFPAPVWEQTVAHELGHLAGLEHADGGVMGTGRLPEDMRLSDRDLDQLTTAWCR